MVCVRRSRPCCRPPLFAERERAPEKFLVPSLMQQYNIGAVAGNLLFIAEKIFVRVPPVRTGIHDLHIKVALPQSDLKKMWVCLVVVQAVSGCRRAAEAKNTQLPALLLGIKDWSAKSEVVDCKYVPSCEIFLKVDHATSPGRKKKDIENSEGKRFRISIFSKD